jgi:predicted aspartyl protease
VSISLLGPVGAVSCPGLLDTGADDTVFPFAVAQQAGIDLTNAPTHTFAGVGGPPYALSYARVTLRLSDGREHREWEAWVGFTTAPMSHALLGFAGCLQFFTASFDGDGEKVELIVNPKYPGR